MWAWVGIAGSTAQTGFVTSVDGQTLAAQVPAVNPVTGLKATARYTNATAIWRSSTGATYYRVFLTWHKGVILNRFTVQGTSVKIEDLQENTSYGVKVRALPAASGAEDAMVHVTTK